MDSRTDGPIADDELDGLFRPLRGRNLALAVSGGVDSMVLLHLISRWARMSIEKCPTDQVPDLSRVCDLGLPRRPPVLGARASWLTEPAEIPPPIVVLSVDHALRLGSADDASFVTETAASLGFPSQTLTWQHAAPEVVSETDSDNGRSSGPSATPTTGIQQKARAARYTLMADVIEDELWARFGGRDNRHHPLRGSTARRMIVTAHHREDLIETFLMRLQRGSGLDGLAAMRAIETFNRPPIPSRNYPSPVDVARPLLDVPRARLLATAKAAQLAWKEDPSNDDVRYERIRLRAAAPSLASAGFEPSGLHRSIRRLRASRDTIETECRRWIDHAIDMNAGLFANIRLRDPLSRSKPHDFPFEPSDHILLGLLTYAINAFGGSHPAPELSRLEALKDIIQRSTPNSRQLERTLGGCRVAAWADDDGRPARIHIWRESGRAGFPELVLEPGDGGWWDNRFAISVAPEASAPVVIRALGLAGWTELKRRVPALAEWRGLPPGAAATLPAVWHSEDLLTAPWFDRLPDTLPIALRQSISADWSAAYGSSRNLFKLGFSPLAPSDI